MLHVRVRNHAAGVLRHVGEAGAVGVGVQRRIQVVIAEHVAPVECQSSSHQRAESIDARGHVRLAHRVKRQMCVVRFHARGLSRRQTGIRVVQQLHHVGLLATRRRQAGGFDALIRVRQRPAGQCVFGVNQVHVIAAIFVGAQRELLRIHRRRNGRAQRGDAADACVHIRHLSERTRIDVHHVDVADAVAIGDEIHAAPVCVPLRVDALAFVERPHRPDLRGGDIEDGKLVLARAQVFEMR